LKFGGKLAKVGVGRCYLGAKFYFVTRLFRGGYLEEYEIKPVLFLFVFELVAATKTLFKTNERKNNTNTIKPWKCFV